jgi:hypothetical protein
MPKNTPPAEPDEGAVTTDSLAADVADEEIDYPDGAPILVPMLALPRMIRADAYEALGKIQAYQKQVRLLDPDEPDVENGDENATEKVREIDPETFGAQYRVVAYIEEYLRAVAKTPKEFDAWAKTVDDADLVKTFNVYIRKTQPGEAKSSAG